MPPINIKDNISAPTAGPKPKSMQNATIWTCGIDIATQQPIPAIESKMVSILGDICTLARLFSEAASEILEVSSVIFLESKKDKGIITKTVAIANMPYTSLHPSDCKVVLKIGGQTAPEK